LATGPGHQEVAIASENIILGAFHRWAWISSLRRQAVVIPLGAPIPVGITVPLRAEHISGNWLGSKLSILRL
jgi:hypothetical protein